MGKWHIFIAALLILGTVFTLSVVSRSNHAQAALPLTCRPSAPELLAAQDPRPVLLAFGNSLIFDNDWRMPNYLVVNCARQGLVVRQAQNLLDDLPDVAPTTLLMGFGSVEAIRATLLNAPLDDTDFEVAMAQTLDTLQNRWPDTVIVLASVPAWKPDRQFSIIVAQSDAAALNVALRNAVQGRPNVTFLDLSQLPSGTSDTRALWSYDGRHLLPAVYREWEDALRKVLTQKE